MAARRSAVIPKPRAAPAASERRPPGLLARTARRARSWLVWWVILLAFWVIID